MWKREPITISDTVFFLLGVVVSILTYGALLISYRTFPEQVPVHYNFFGTPDAFMAKGFWSVFGTAIIHFCVAILLLWAHAHPEYANIPGRVPLSKIKQPYKRSIEWIIRHMTVMLFVLISLIFSYLSLTMIVIGFGFAAKLNPIPLFVFTTILAALLIFYFFMIRKITRLAAKKKKLPVGW